jgi:nicotinamidase-related amidase
MKVLQFNRPLKRESLPIFVFAGLQLEYVSEGRAHFMASGSSAVRNCGRLLDRLRSLKMPIAHFRLLQTGHFFNRASPFSRWIDAVRPQPNEYVFEHPLPSCYSSSAFCELMDGVEQPEIILSGLSGEFTCLSTVIEGFHRRHKTTFVADCSASSMAGLGESEAHKAVHRVAELYVDVVSLDDVLSQLDAVGDRLCRR